MTEPYRVAYDPRQHQRLSFAAARQAFRDGRDTPRAFLERCIETLSARDPSVRAFVTTNLPGARAAADAATERYRAGSSLSVVDGLPIGIKDLYETADMPTQLNSPLFSGWHSGQDSAHVYALRRGGAAIVGKTVTTEFGQATPGPTRNPFDSDRTPGGSSSGTSAAVGAGMLPCATGSQVRGSIIRPAGYCANYALKPSFGTLNRQGGHGLAPSQSVLGVHAATIVDCWATAYYISSTAGGDPGSPGLIGETELGEGQKIKRLIQLDTLGHDKAEPTTLALFADFVKRLQKMGIEIVTRRDDPRIEALEQALRTIPSFMFPIFQWEMRWPGWLYRDRGAHLMAKVTLDRLERGEKMTIEDYRQALDKREAMRRAFTAASELGDACIALCAHGPAPVGMDVGDPVYADISSCSGGPAVSLPLLALDALPIGVQLVGLPGQDYRLMRQGRWLAETWLAAAP